MTILHDKTTGTSKPSDSIIGLYKERQLIADRLFTLQQLNRIIEKNKESDHLSTIDLTIIEFDLDKPSNLLKLAKKLPDHPQVYHRYLLDCLYNNNEPDEAIVEKARKSTLMSETTFKKLNAEYKMFADLTREYRQTNTVAETLENYYTLTEKYGQTIEWELAKKWLSFLDIDALDEIMNRVDNYPNKNKDNIAAIMFNELYPFYNADNKPISVLYTHGDNLGTMMTTNLLHSGKSEKEIVELIQAINLQSLKLHVNDHNIFGRIAILEEKMGRTQNAIELYMMNAAEILNKEIDPTKTLGDAIRLYVTDPDGVMNKLSTNLDSDGQNDKQQILLLSQFIFKVMHILQKDEYPVRLRNAHSIQLIDFITQYNSRNHVVDQSIPLELREKTHSATIQLKNELLKKVFSNANLAKYQNIIDKHIEANPYTKIKPINLTEQRRRLDKKEQVMSAKEILAAMGKKIDPIDVAIVALLITATLFVDMHSNKGPTLTDKIKSLLSALNESDVKYSCLVPAFEDQLTNDGNIKINRSKQITIEITDMMIKNQIKTTNIRNIRSTNDILKQIKKTINEEKPTHIQVTMNTYNIQLTEANINYMLGEVSNNKPLDDFIYFADDFISDVIEEQEAEFNEEKIKETQRLEKNKKNEMDKQKNEINSRRQELSKLIEDNANLLSPINLSQLACKQIPDAITDLQNTISSTVTEEIAISNDSDPSILSEINTKLANTITDTRDNLAKLSTLREQFLEKNKLANKDALTALNKKTLKCRETCDKINTSNFGGKLAALPEYTIDALKALKDRTTNDAAELDEAVNMLLKILDKGLPNQSEHSVSSFNRAITAELHEIKVKGKAIVIKNLFMAKTKNNYIKFSKQETRCINNIDQLKTEAENRG